MDGNVPQRPAMDRLGDVLIVGGGIGGLTLALELHKRGLPCRVFESAPQIKSVGVGINLLPHATKLLGELGLVPRLLGVSVETAEAAFFNRFGQLIYREPLGKRAGYDWPQISIHRGELQAALIEAFKERLGPDRLHLGAHVSGFSQDGETVTLPLKKGFKSQGGRFDHFGLLTPGVGGQLIRIYLDDLTYTATPK